MARGKGPERKAPAASAPERKPVADIRARDGGEGVVVSGCPSDGDDIRARRDGTHAEPSKRRFGDAADRRARDGGEGAVVTRERRRPRYRRRQDTRR